MLANQEVNVKRFSTTDSWDTRINQPALTVYSPIRGPPALSVYPQHPPSPTALLQGWEVGNGNLSGCPLYSTPPSHFRKSAATFSAMAAIPACKPSMRSGWFSGLVSPTPKMGYDASLIHPTRAVKGGPQGCRGLLGTEWWANQHLPILPDYLTTAKFVVLALFQEASKWEESPV